MVAAQYGITGRTASEITASVESAVRGGALAPGAALPPVRMLAAGLGVAPGTVASAYRALRDRGLVQTDGRRGTRVRARPAVAARGGSVLPASPGDRDLSTGQPDPSLLPPLGPALARLPHDPAVGPTTFLLPRLLELARGRLGADGVPAEALTLTSGALDAVERVLSAHLRPGDAVAVEDPGWPNLLDLVAGLGLHPLPVAVDDEGPRPEALEHALRSGARAVVVTSRAHNPTGAAVTRDRATALRAVLSSRPGTVLVEDDHAGELAGVPLAPLAGTTAVWAFVRSASKPYGPDLRLAVCAGDAVTISRVEGRMRLGAGWVSTVLQQLVVDLWSDAAAAAVVARAGEQYAVRRSALLAALAGHGVPASGRTGINVWVPVPDETSAVTRLLSAGWVAAPGARFRLASAPGVRLTVSALAEDDVPELAQAVAHAVAAPGAPSYRA